MNKNDDIFLPMYGSKLTASLSRIIDENIFKSLIAIVNLDDKWNLNNYTYPYNVFAKILIL